MLIHSTCACNWLQNVINSARGHCPCPLPGRICLRGMVTWWGLYVRFLWYRTFKYMLCICKAFLHCVQFPKNIFDSHWLNYPHPVCLVTCGGINYFLENNHWGPSICFSMKIGPICLNYIAHMLLRWLSPAASSLWDLSVTHRHNKYVIYNLLL